MGLAKVFQNPRESRALREYLLKQVTTMSFLFFHIVFK